MALLTRGFPTACLLSTKQELVHQKALKALHTLFDMEVSAAAWVQTRSCRASAHWQPLLSTTHLQAVAHVHGARCVHTMQSA